MERDNSINVSDREDGVIWRYLRHGRVLHALSAGRYGHALFSRCGLRLKLVSRPADDWFGTGNRAEHERAAGLPRCQRCQKGL